MSTYISCVETAKLVRQALKESFPKVKFSVRSDTYAGGASINVGWTDGPNDEQVKAVVNKFKGSYFDSSIDYKGSVYSLLDGKRVSFGADSIFCKRKLSDSTLSRLLARCASEYGTKIHSVEEFRTGQLWDVYGPSKQMHWSIQAIVNRMAAKHTFVITKRSPTLERTEVLHSDGYSLAQGSGMKFGDDEVIVALKKAGSRL